MKHIWYWKIEETKSCERYLILKFLREAIKTISLSNFLSQPSQAGKIFNCSIQNVIWNSNIRDTKGFSMKKNNKNDVIEISKNMEMSLHQRYQFLSYSCFDCLLSTKIRLPRLHSAHNLLKVWTMKNCANKQGDKFWCPPNLLIKIHLGFWIILMGVIIPLLLYTFEYYSLDEGQSK